MNDERGGIIIPLDLKGGTLQRQAVFGKAGTVSVDPANQGGAASFDTDVTVSGVKTGDLIFMQPPATLEDTLTFIGAVVQTTDTVRIRLRASGAVNGAARDWAFIHIRVAG